MKDSDSSITFATLFAGTEGIDLGNYREGVIALENEWYPGTQPDNEEHVDDQAKNKWTAVVLALNEEHVVGYGSLTQSLRKNEMNLSSAFVTEPFRGQGIYKKLVTDRVEIARQRGAETVRLNAAKTNMAKNWLSEFGFTAVSATNDGSVVSFRMHL